MCTYCTTRLINSLGHTLSNDFIETTFYGRTLSSFSSVEHTCVAIFFLRWPNEHVTSKFLYRSKSITTNQESKSFSLTTWEHSLFSSLSKHFILPCFHLGITNLQGLRISQRGFYNTKMLRYNFQANTIGIVRQKNRHSFARFKEYFLTFQRSLLLYVEDQANLLCCLQLIGSNRCEPVVEVRPETIGRDYRSRSDSHRASPMPRIKVQGYLTTQRNPSVYFTGE